MRASDELIRKLAEENGPGVFPEAFDKNGDLRADWPIARSGMKLIEEIRAVNYSWVDTHPTDEKQVIERHEFRIEIRREGEKEWTEIPVMARQGRP